MTTQNVETKAPAPKTWKPLVGGITAITAGVFDLLGTLGLTIAIAVIGTSDFIVTEADIYPLTVSGLNAILAAVAVFLGVAGIVAIIGGIFALQRKLWGLALAGSIAAVLPFWVFGITSIVFTAISREEFV
jgi:hypothetical protein